MPTILFTNNDISIEVAEGTSILEAALDNGVNLNSDCDSNGICGSCLVWIDDGMDSLSKVYPEEEDLLLQLDNYISDKSRLSCQAYVHGDIVVTIPQ